ncbi:MAG: hydroxylase [Rhodococcus sp. (in: high G+C Gram-positive bacteria)]|nr:MAG: hydroxylase [Rhodococcus sp. (in: high G+C Gram-positive bacteria)]
MAVPSIDVKTSNAPATLTPADALTSAVALRPQLVAEAPEGEARTFHSEELHLEFVERGFYHLLRPKMFGGYEFGVRDFMAVIRELARGDMGAAWCLCLASGHNLQFASWWPESAQREVFGDGHFAAAMTSAPGGTMRRGDSGDWIVNGTFPYASGGPYSTHFMGHVFAETAEQSKQLSTFIIPRSDFTIRDDWGKTLGLKGSGSHTLDVREVSVSAHFVLEGKAQVDMNVDNGTPGLELHRNPLYAGRGIGFFGLELASLAVGGVHAALDEYETILRTKKTPMPPFTLRSENSRYQTWYSDAVNALAAADATLDRAADLFLEYSTRGAEGGKPFDQADDLYVGRLAVHAQNVVWRALEGIIMRTAGSSAATNGSRLERIWRDSTMVLSHQNSIVQDFIGADYAAAALVTRP